MKLPTEGKNRSVDKAERDIFLKSLAETGNIFLACHASRLTRRGISQLLQTDSDFAAAYDEAMDEAADRIEAEVWRRGLEGVSEPLIRAGQIVRDAQTGEPVMTRRYSDPLLVLLLKGSKPEKYDSRGARNQVKLTSDLIEEIARDRDPPCKRE